VVIEGPLKATVTFQWVIYEHPLDFPGSYVLRVWFISPGKVLPGGLLAVGTLELCRNHIPKHAVLLHGPGVDPDPKIYEVWV